MITLSPNSDPGLRRRPAALALILCLMLAALALVDLLPLGYMAALSLEKSAAAGGNEASGFGGAWPRLFRSAPFFARWFLNSAAVAVLTVGFHLIADTMAAYVLAKWKFRGRGTVFLLIILSMMVPRQVTLIPLFLGMSRAGLADSFAGLFLPGLGDLVGVFLIRQFLLTLPDSLIEAARMDGASQWAVFRHIIVPISRPAMAVMGVLAFQHYWSDFFWPLVITHSEANFTLPVGLSYMSQSEFGPDLPLMAAGACAAAIPSLAVFMVFRRTFFDGFRGGALK